MTTEQSRLAPLAAEDLDADQRAVYDAIQNSPRGASLRSGSAGIGLIGPFGLWVRAPQIGQAAQALGAAVRFGATLAADAREVAICTVGAHYRAKFEFAAHGPMALAAGVPGAVVDAIRRGAEPDFTDPAQALAYRVARSLLTDHRLDDDRYRLAVATFGETGTIELVTTVGYYCLISLSLNAFEIPLAAGMSDPFTE